jgi:hypothetical protein
LRFHDLSEYNADFDEVKLFAALEIAAAPLVVMTMTLPAPLPSLLFKIQFTSKVKAEGKFHPAGESQHGAERILKP